VDRSDPRPFASPDRRTGAPRAPGRQRRGPRCGSAPLPSAPAGASPAQQRPSRPSTLRRSRTAGPTAVGALRAARSPHGVQGCRRRRRWSRAARLRRSRTAGPPAVGALRAGPDQLRHPHRGQAGTGVGGIAGGREQPGCGAAGRPSCRTRTEFRGVVGGREQPGAGRCPLRQQPDQPGGPGHRRRDDHRSRGAGEPAAPGERDLTAVRAGPAPARGAASGRRLRKHRAGPFSGVERAPARWVLPRGTYLPLAASLSLEPAETFTL
jgi:hypothetical protein